MVIAPLLEERETASALLHLPSPLSDPQRLSLMDGAASLVDQGATVLVSEDAFWMAIDEKAIETVNLGARFATQRDASQAMFVVGHSTRAQDGEPVFWVLGANGQRRAIRLSAIRRRVEQSLGSAAERLSIVPITCAYRSGGIYRDITLSEAADIVREFNTLRVSGYGGPDLVTRSASARAQRRPVDPRTGIILNAASRRVLGHDDEGGLVVYAATGGALLLATVAGCAAIPECQTSGLSYLRAWTEQSRNP
ncbi:MAG: hypothetical protein RLO52_06940 [Sandaracinaceae bacterium]